VSGVVLALGLVAVAGSQARSVTAAETPVVRVGLERLEAEGGAALSGKRLGLLVHGASLTADGRHAVDVLRGLGLDVRRLFSPEHGLRGQAAAGEAVDGGSDVATGLPIVSLYGAKTRPAPEDLAGLDTLVVDLQDAGVRFYTYVSTLLLCLEAAAEAGVEVVVLDRPNPLGGERIEGPVSDPREVVPASLVNLAPGPLVHGLTLGEMARLANARSRRPARLRVVPLEGWRRSMLWRDTGRRWVAPSPNLRSAEAALAYPGTCLLEATNVSEGRGAEAPFLLLGAPWLDVDALRRAVTAAGFALEPARFTPRASAAARQPRYQDTELPGVRLQVTEPRAARPYALGVALLIALRRQPGFAWRGPEALDRLVGTRRLREALESGRSVAEIVAADVADHAAWRKERDAVLVYR